MCDERGVPNFLYPLIDLLHLQATTEGIFRINGSLRTIKDTMTAINNGEPFVEIQKRMNLEDIPLSVAGVLKHFFMLMDPPLFPYEFHSAVVETDMKELQDLDLQLDFVSRTIYALPDEIYAVLQQIMTFLFFVKVRSDKNMMNADSLATCFATLIREETTINVLIDKTSPEALRINVFMAYLIENFDMVSSNVKELNDKNAQVYTNNAFHDGTNIQHSNKAIVGTAKPFMPLL